MVVVPLVLWQLNQSRERAAQAAGFANIEDRDAAKIAGFSDPRAWSVEKSRRADGERARRATEQAAMDARCREDLTCWGPLHEREASSACAQPLEGLAKDGFRWMGADLDEQRFSFFTWKSRSSGVVRYHGNRLEFRDSHGTWLQQSYECEFNTIDQVTVTVRAPPGQLGF
jgi:hypothetical protein